MAAQPLEGMRWSSGGLRSKLSGLEALHEEGEVMEKELPAPEVQGFLFPEGDEPLDVSAGGFPVDLSDSFFQARL
jgi:hypothetical protein